MKRKTLALCLSGLLIFAGCGQGAEDGINHQEERKEMVTSESGSEPAQPSDDSHFKIEVPEGWVEIDNPKLGTDWKKGYDNSASNPSVRLKFNDNYGDNSNVRVVSAKLFGQANFGDSYGKDVTVERREFDHKFDGADESEITVFNYTSGKGSKMRGCWWVLRNADTLAVAVVEVHGLRSEVSDSFLNQIQQSISFDG